MLSILIVDDELPARRRLRRMLAGIDGVRIAGEAASGQEALQQLAEHAPDALLLDISMPGLDGMTLAQTLQQGPNSPAVIFCTALSDQAVEAFECNAVDYLVKPVRLSRLKAALDKAGRFLNRGAPASEPFLRSMLGGKVKLLPLSQVVCLLAEDKYTTAVHSGGKAVVNQSLLELEKRYASEFVRVHRGALVKKARIRGLEKTPDRRHFVLLDGSDERPQISRRNLPAIRKLIRNLS